MCSTYPVNLSVTFGYPRSQISFIDTAAPRMPIARPKQFPSGFLVAALLAASGLLWAVMFFGPLAHITHPAGGLTPFDIRPKGYSYAEARAFLEAIGEQGRRYYANPELVI